MTYGKIILCLFMLSMNLTLVYVFVLAFLMYLAMKPQFCQEWFKKEDKKSKKEKKNVSQLPGMDNYVSLIVFILCDSMDAYPTLSQYWFPVNVHFVYKIYKYCLIKNTQIMDVFSWMSMKCHSFKAMKSESC